MKRPSRPWVRLAATVLVGAATSVALAGERFYPILPCRAIDTRFGDAGGVLNHGEARAMPIIGPRCGIPAGATAAAFNLTMVGPAPGSGHIILFPYNTPIPVTSVLNFAQGEVALGNGALVGLTAGTNNVSVLPQIAGGGQIHFIIDVTGYFAP